MTGYNELPASKEDVARADVRATVQKPLDPDTFMHLVARLLARA